MELFFNDKVPSIIIEDNIRSSTGKKFELQERIGAGGNGAVYSCIDIMGDEYAVKFLIHRSKKSNMRFAQEIKILRKINHPHVIRYIDSGCVEGIVQGHKSEVQYYVMEKADGNLVDFLKREQKIDYSIYSGQFRGLCDALRELHGFAIHRDIKPENILVKGDRWVLSDFGLGEFITEEHLELTKAYEKVGPPLWMSPEAINDFYFGTDSIGPYSDVYQLGAVFAFVLTKKSPCGIIEQNNDMCTTPAIKNLLLSSLSNNPMARPQNGDALLQKYAEATLAK